MPDSYRLYFTDPSGNYLAEYDTERVTISLSPEERAEYDLRFSEIATRNAQRYTRMQVTEKEFRAIQPLVRLDPAAAIDLPACVGAAEV